MTTITRSVTCSLAAALLCTAPLAAQLPRAVDQHIERNRGAIVNELVEFLRIPNVASDSVNIRRNAQALLGMMETRGIRGRLLEVDGPPMVYGELLTPGATTTLLFYAHYDGQPVNPEQWIGHGPFEPVLRAGTLEQGAAIIPFPSDGRFQDDWRIYARSSSDDKSPIVALMAALDALGAGGLRPTVNLKFLFEGDEEAGSPNLESVVRQHADLLRSDLVVMIDGPMHPSHRPTVVFGARGITSAQIVVYGADRPLHSGHYGNWAPNPGMLMARLLASMKDDNGRVLIQGWYDDVVPLSAEERAAIAAIQDESPSDYGFMEPEGGPGAQRLERIALPSLNVRGLQSGWVGKDARTLVPDSAIAELDLRLVPRVDPDRQIQRLLAHIRAQDFHVTRESPDSATRVSHAKIARVNYREGGYPASRTSFDHPVARQLTEAVRRAFPEPPIRMPTMGGSVPASWFPVVTGTETLLLPLVNMDNNQHAENENLRLGNFFTGIRILAAVLRM